MNREVCKFLSGSFAGLAYVHAAYAVATSRGIINEPVFLGRRWLCRIHVDGGRRLLCCQSGPRIRRLGLQTSTAATEAGTDTLRWGAAEQATHNCRSTKSHRIR